MFKKFFFVRYTRFNNQIFCSFIEVSTHMYINMKHWMKSPKESWNMYGRNCPCTIQYSPSNLCLSSLVKWLKGDKTPDRELQWNNQAINRTKYYPKHGETKHTLCNQYFPCLRYSLGIYVPWPCALQWY